MNKPRLRPYNSKLLGPGMKFECRGPIVCPVTHRPTTGYGFGATQEQAYSNWLNSPIPF